MSSARTGKTTADAAPATKRLATTPMNRALARVTVSAPPPGSHSNRTVRGNGSFFGAKSPLDRSDQSSRSAIVPYQSNSERFTQPGMRGPAFMRSCIFSLSLPFCIRSRNTAPAQP